jgi:lysine 2,3-aminomutase
MTRFLEDPLQEEKFRMVKGLIFKYPKRVLVELNNICPVYCQFCTRKREIFKKEKWELGKKEIKDILNFLKKDKKIREVIVSGGDPLMSPVAFIELLKGLEKNKNIKIIRIHTRMPITAPSEINQKIFDFLSNFKKMVYLSIHCNLVEEISNETIGVINKFRKTGVILYSQSVLLRGINDSAEKLEKLFEKLLELGVRPYCIYRCDKVIGLEKFVVPVKKEKEIMIEVRKIISGLASPIYVIDGLTKKKFIDWDENLIEND